MKLEPAAQAFLRERYVAVFVTTRPDGTPHAVPVWFEYEPGEGGGVFRICTDPDSVKVRNLLAARGAWATLCIAAHEPPYRYVTAEGPASLETARDPDSAPHRLLRRLAVRYLGEPDGQRYADSLRGEALTMVTVAARRLRWYDEGTGGAATV